MTSAELKHRAKLQEWSARIQDCRSSGLSVRAWCRQEEINAAVDAINNAIDKLEVKPVDPDKPAKPEKPMDPVKPTKPGVATGDNTNFMAIGTLLVAATGIALLKKKKKEN